ncbi:MAG: CehA/McbA family metallohydrolase [Candidatus Undinarchaeales archaeon]|jgi:hypothetical protein|nr:CehA/McbA family metallohydrolase [Candidatus Undinarchaeales archaeon]MDP7493979.1 CehA/McbA family metallohydrolase [Candidatus Undinarchaeales archaeon]
MMEDLSLGEEIAQLREQGYDVFDLHGHSRYSDGDRTPEQMVRYAHDLGLSGIAITDHDGIKGYERARAEAEKYNDGFIVVPGEEVSSEKGHILAYGVSQKVLGGLSLEETTSLIHEQGGVAVAAHPYSTLGTGDPLSFEELSDRQFSLLDGVETYNGSVLWPKDANEKAEKLAETYGLAKIGGSDAHTRWAQGLGLTITEDVNDVEGLLEAIREGRTDSVKAAVNDRTSIKVRKYAEYFIGGIPRGIRYLWTAFRERFIDPEENEEHP